MVHAEDIYYVGYKLQLRLPYKRNGSRVLSRERSRREVHRQARMEIKKDGSLSVPVSLLLNKLLPADKE